MSPSVKHSKELKESFIQSMILKEESDLTYTQEVLLANLCMLILLRGNM